MHTAIITFLIAASAPQIFAAVFITNPVATTSAQGGQSLTINWQDDNSTPTLADIGPCEIGLFAGNMQQQTELQPINPSVDVSTQTSQSFNLDATIGPNSSGYFIRFTALNFKDPKNPQFAYEAFSAKFALSNMSGQFNSTVQAQVNGVTSASAAASTPGLTSASTAATSAASGMTTVKASTTTTKSSATSSTTAKSTQSSAAMMVRSNGVVMCVFGFAAVLVGLSL